MITSKNLFLRVKVLKKCLVICSCMVLQGTLLTGHVQALENSSATLLSLNFQKNFSNGYYSSLSLNARFREGLSELNSRYVFFNAGRNQGASQYGFGLYASFPENKQFTERRMLQRYRYRFPLAASYIDVTGFLDERYFVNIDKAGLRTRLTFNWVKSLNDKTELTIGNQWFINLTDIGDLSAAQSGFNQTRLVFGLRRDFQNGDRLDTSYQLRFINHPFSDNYFLHQVNFTYNFRL